ncbi:hypothetical protein KZZ52_55530 [Dactylosporangium sp. AC04546]|uniref:hypothetical protein n=1 Tax=Dactylosporangium sp. AC04546 TaxID=2862460 RepID=UPI001EE04766|nr:hypothetical protein [Dactylosporangium sp. AC04546]WVK83041.1 hypothetical protein KZZ52_55530 [Dactylosporangium sp. AC04546]
MTRVRAIAHWATAAMLAVAAAALANLALAFAPLADIWAAHRPGAEPSALAGTVRIVIALALAASLTAAAVAAWGWHARARANLVAFGVSDRRVITGSVGRVPRLRRSMVVLTWVFRGLVLAGAVATVLGVLSGLDNAGEIGHVRHLAAAGEPVDRALVAGLFGRQLVLRLPGAALLVGAAGAAVLLIARTTSAQYGRIARLRTAGGTIRE